MEVGFIVGKIAQEDTGFAQSANDSHDKVAIETNSNMGEVLSYEVLSNPQHNNAGINTVEEGIAGSRSMTLRTVFNYTLPGQERYLVKKVSSLTAEKTLKALIQQAERHFRLLSDTELEEIVKMTLNDGGERQFKKVFVKIEDYLKAPLARM